MDRAYRKANFDIHNTRVTLVVVVVAVNQVVVEVVEEEVEPAPSPTKPSTDRCPRGWSSSRSGGNARGCVCGRGCGCGCEKLSRCGCENGCGRAPSRTHAHYGKRSW